MYSIFCVSHQYGKEPIKTGGKTDGGKISSESLNIIRNLGQCSSRKGNYQVYLNNYLQSTL
jgi:hypothetical protein